MNRLRSTRANLERGFSLFEVLITVVVISIGLLGLAGLQFAGLRASNNAQEHTYANLLAQDIEERIRANPGGNYTAISLSTGGSAPTALYDCATTSCSASNMRNYDKKQWYYTIKNGGAGYNVPILPNTTINVLGSVKDFLHCNGGDYYIITISWGDPSGLQTLPAQYCL